MTTIRYGGNTSSVEVRTASDRLLVLDAGTGIHALGQALRVEQPSRIDLLLTHLHLDHVEGLGLFAPLFDGTCEITIWGPPQPGTSLRERLSTFLSPPSFRYRFEELPAGIEFVEVRDEKWELDGVSITAAPVAHPGNTLAYRITEGRRSLAFIPDNEPGLDPGSGLELAQGAGVLFHDAQYTSEEYATRIGWGHTGLDDLARFVRAARPERVVMFHHDPSHCDAHLDRMHAVAEELAGREMELASEGLDIQLS